jgi:hypothetical protein
MQYSSTTKQMAISLYPQQFKELVRAYINSSDAIDLQKRIGELCKVFEAMEMKQTYQRLLIELAQDYTATVLLLQDNPLQSPTHPLISS